MIFSTGIPILLAVVLSIRRLSDRGTDHGLPLAFLTIEYKYLSTLSGVVDIKVGEAPDYFDPRRKKSHSI